MHIFDAYLHKKTEFHPTLCSVDTAQKMKFSIKDFSSKYEQIRSLNTRKFGPETTQYLHTFQAVTPI